MSDREPMRAGHIHSFGLRYKLVNERVKKRYGWMLSFNAVVEFARPKGSTGWAECEGIEEVKHALVGGLSDLTGVAPDLVSFGDQNDRANCCLYTWGTEALRKSDRNNVVWFTWQIFIPYDSAKKTPTDPDEAVYRLLKRARSEAEQVVQAAFAKGVERGLKKAEQRVAHEEMAERANNLAGWLLKTAAEKAKATPIIPQIIIRVPDTYDGWVEVLRAQVESAVPDALRAAHVEMINALNDPASAEKWTDDDKAAGLAAWEKLMEKAAATDPTPAPLPGMDTVGFARVKARLWADFYSGGREEPLLSAKDFETEREGTQ